MSIACTSSTAKRIRLLCQERERSASLLESRGKAGLRQCFRVQESTEGGSLYPVALLKSGCAEGIHSWTPHRATTKAVKGCRIICKNYRPVVCEERQPALHG